jgi:hypothetical protein
MLGVKKFLKNCRIAEVFWEQEFTIAIAPRRYREPQAFGPVFGTHYPMLCTGFGLMESNHWESSAQVASSD